MPNENSRAVQLVALLIAFTFSNVFENASAQDQRTSQFKYEQAMYDYFGRSPFYAVPIFLSGPRESGDTLTIGMYDRYAPREFCFSKLGKPTLSKSDLAKQQEIDGEAFAGSAHVSVKKIASVATGANYDRIHNYTVSFTNVQIDETPLVTLQNSADYSKCSFLKQLMGTSDGTLILTHFIVHGTRELNISLNKGGGGKADVGIVSGLMSKLFGGAQVEASYDGQTHSLLSIKGNALVPIAFRPAFVSIDDVLVREQQIKKGIDKVLEDLWKSRNFKNIKEKVGGVPGLLVSPAQILSSMLVGKGQLVAFNPKESQRDQAYMNMVTLNLLVSSELFGTFSAR